MSRTSTAVAEAEKKPDAKAEMQALLAVMTALETLNGAQRARALRYARDFFNVYMGDA